MEHNYSNIAVEAIATSYSPTLVMLSTIVAIISSFSAFGLAERGVSSSQKNHKLAWGLFGAITMGIGIWAMHFIALLALKLPIPVTYDVPITVISIFPAAIAYGVVLWLLAQKTFNHYRLLMGGLLLGSGIGLMHYTGMAAMNINATMIHDTALVYLSIFIAVILAIVALKIMFGAIDLNHYQFINKRKIFSAVVMGLATSCMHYTAMAAVHFIPQTSNKVIIGIDPPTLAITVTCVILLLLSIAILIPHLLRYKQIISTMNEDTARIHAIIDSAHDALIHMNDRGQIIGWNFQAQCIFGWTAHEAIGQELASLIIPPRLRNAHNQGLQAFLVTGKGPILNKMIEIEALHQDGHDFAIELTISYIKIKSGFEFHAFIRDISGRKAIERDLKLSHFSLDHAQDAILRVDKNGRIIYANEAACRHLAYTSEELLLLSITDISPDINWQESWEKIRNTSKQRFEAIHKKKDGTLIPVEVSSTYIEFDGEAYSFSAVRNISERKRSEDVLRTLAETGSEENEDIFKTIVQQLAQIHNMRHAFIGQLSKDSINTLAVWADDNFMANFSFNLTGTPCQSVLQDDFCFFADNIQALFPNDRLLIDLDVRSYIGVTLKNKQHEVIGVIALLDPKPMSKIPQTLSLLNSLTVRAGIELERREAEEKHKLSSRIFDETHEAIIISTTDGIIIDVNPTFTAITGYSRKEVLGNNTSMLNSGRHNHEFYTDLWQTVAKEGYWQGELWNRKKDGTLFPELLTISALKDEATHQTTHYISFFTDITQSKRQQEELEIMAHYDVLTKLPNRILFADRFHQAAAHSKRTKTLVAVCFLDLDHFKTVNDNFGHEMGDRLLVEVAKRIKGQLRVEDTLSRQGGDEFALLLTDIGSFSDCEQVLKRIYNALTQPYVINEQAFEISASVGVTLYPNDDSDLDTLLRHADQAMYQAKLAGRNRFDLFNTEEDQKLIEKHHQLEEIQNALINNEFRLFYQPKVNMRTGHVFGFEALIRWLHPTKGMLPPLAFLPVSDGTNLEIEIGNWVINQALQQLTDWKKQGIELEISINVASRHLLSATFINNLATSLAAYPDAGAKYLQLEILESSALGDIETISTIITTCQNLFGIRIALDDFGTGYSSLTHMRKLSADIIKIDQSFVRDMLNDPDDYTIINGVIGLANAFNREVIAEGVETTKHGLMLLKMGCEQAQGYAIAQPMPAEDISVWLDNYRPNDEWMALGNELPPTHEKRH